MHGSKAKQLRMSSSQITTTREGRSNEVLCDSRSAVFDRGTQPLRQISQEELDFALQNLYFSEDQQTLISTVPASALFQHSFLSVSLPYDDTRRVAARPIARSCPRESDSGVTRHEKHRQNWPADLHKLLSAATSEGEQVSRPRLQVNKNPPS